MTERIAIPTHAISPAAIQPLAIGDFTALAAGDPAAPLVLVLHGFPDAPPSFAPLLALLADAGYRAVAPWMRGYAPSPLAGPYDADTLATDVVALADALSPARPVALVGHDWGALVTYVACARAPDRIAAAAALSVPHPATFLRSLTRGGQLARSWYMLAFQLPGSARAAAAFDFALVDRLWRTWSPHYTQPADDRATLHTTLRASWPAPLLYYRALFRPFRPALARARRRDSIAVPLLYLHGATDGCISASCADGAEHHFSDTYRRELLPGGHFLASEDPAALAARLTPWLATHHPR